MFTEVRLANYRSFGPEQRVPLQPITVLVGPNNSGKSCFLEFFGQFGAISARDMHPRDWCESAAHRPGTGAMAVHISGRLGAYKATVLDNGGTRESLTLPGGARLVNLSNNANDAFRGICGWQVPGDDPRAPELGAFQKSLRANRIVRLSRQALRADVRLPALAAVGTDGSGLAAAIREWRSLDDDRFRQLDAFVSRSAPEVQKILARTVEGQAYRLVVEQKDGQQFDAGDVSDGILHLIGLAAHAVSVENGSLLLIEEPEAAIHPRRLTEYVELLQTIIEQKKCQVILVTHSPVLVRAFKDEPEAIVHFSRGPDGTRVTPLVEMPDAMKRLRESDADPGELLVGGFLTQEASAA